MYSQVVERNNSCSHMVAYVIEEGNHYIVDNSIGFFVVACKESFAELGFIFIKNCYQVIWKSGKIELPPYEPSDYGSDSSDSSNLDTKPSPERRGSDIDSGIDSDPDTKPSSKRRKVVEDDDCNDEVVPATPQSENNVDEEVDEEVVPETLDNVDEEVCSGAGEEVESQVHDLSECK